MMNNCFENFGIVPSHDAKQNNYYTARILLKAITFELFAKKLPLTPVLYFSNRGHGSKIPTVISCGIPLGTNMPTYNEFCKMVFEKIFKVVHAKNAKKLFQLFTESVAQLPFE